MQLASAKAVITGGASGLGLATARRVIDAGGHAVLLDLNEEQGNASAAELGDRARFILTDVSSEANVKSAIHEAHESMGAITLAVNCAGIIGAARTLGRDGPMAGDFFARTIQVNLIGSFLTAKRRRTSCRRMRPTTRASAA